ncbi:MAG TPA: hypothetical protein PK685_01645 [archaeon]|nr:hypothetical protein [archaeon]
MNKKNLISIFIILICVLFISNGVFAITGIKSTITKNPVCRTDVRDIKILDLKASKYPEVTERGVCGVILITTNSYTYTTDKSFGMGVLISPSPAANIVTNRDLYRSGLYYMDAIYAGGAGKAGKGVDVGTDTIMAYSPSTPNSKTIKLFISKPSICNSPKIDVVIFKPQQLSGMFLQGSQDDTFSCKLINGKLDTWFQTDLAPSGYTSIPLISSNNWIYNLDYAYDVPVSGNNAAANPVDCSTKCSGYTKSTTYPTSAVTVGGQSLSKGQVCYKCNDSGAMADRCNPFNGQKSGFTLNLTNYPDLKREICPNAGTTNTNSGSGTTSAQNTDTGGGSESQQVAASECSSDYNITYELYPNKKFKCVIEGSIPKYQSCSIINDAVIISDIIAFENNSEQFKLTVCSSITQTTDSSTQTSSTPVATLNIVNDIEKNISDINFSLNNTNWYMVNKMDIPKEFLLNNKTQDKSLSIDLSMFREGTVYAIIATTDKKTEIDTELQNIYQTGVFSNNYVDQTTNIFNIDGTFTGFKQLKYILNNNNKNIKLNIKSQNTKNNLVIILMQKSEDNSKVNLSYANLYVLDNKELSQYNFCIINRNIVNFYCKGHNCNSTVSCLKYGRWDFDPKIFEGLTGKAVEPVTPTQPVVQPPTIENPPAQTQSTTLEKGTDGCYTSNPTTLAKIRQEGGIGITKQQFSGKRTMSSIVLPTTNTGTDDDPSLTIAQIRTAFNRSGTNIPQKVKDASPAFYNLGLLYDIDPVFVLSFFKAERSMFNQNSSSVTTTMINNNDISGISACRCGGVDTGNYCRYPTLEQGIEATYLNLTKGTTYSPNLYRNKTFSAVSKSWNGRDSYVTAMTGYLADTYAWAGK